ncbi:MAG TPA: hypothetical protein VL992_19695, partial [Tepidisphaeraceae bacterium]|nr:hypothetical protein [Tepidisphaeraceae bacterium]
LALLFPAVNRARDQANSTLCLSNLRQIGQACLQYSNDYHGYIIPGFANTKLNFASTAPIPNWADAENYATILVNGKYLSAPLAHSVTDPPVRAPSVFQCPSGMTDMLACEHSVNNLTPFAITSRTAGMDDRAWRCVSLSTGVIVDTWYGINLSDMAKDAYSDDPSCKTAGYNIPCRRLPDRTNPTDFSDQKLNQISHPSQVVFLYDGVFDNPWFSPDRISARHDNHRRTNILFLDSHAESVLTASLPGGMGVGGQSGYPATAFEASNLRLHAPPSFLDDGW